jgi:hypothetical protein
MGLPPSEVGGMYRTVNCPDAGPAITLVIVGGPGSVAAGGVGVAGVGVAGVGVTGVGEAAVPDGEGDGDGVLAACAGADASSRDASRLDPARATRTVRRYMGTTQG